MTKLAPPCVKEIKNCLSDRDFKALKTFISAFATMNICIKFYPEDKTTRESNESEV